MRSVHVRSHSGLPARAQWQQRMRYVQVQTGEDYLDMVVTELEGKPLSPEQWYSTIITAIDEASPDLQLDALRTLTDYLVQTKNDTDLSAEARRYFHDRWAEMPEIIIAARERIEHPAIKFPTSSGRTGPLECAPSSGFCS